ncbi:hypothetical protein DVS28_b0013 (plasmid) [Euzebya pacifica]|uniref:Cell wall binding repeat 2 n=1 Tax=Euzebya pacifica TaxID=1608957 RepID=A0A346Y5N6_9ACTN|nr:cell wall-binding repeat-containing protein [Euzebya pacifica]AXV09783.1 hypothetical protein DVS28_b0013 [Euzebya pacifica]
MSRVLSAALVLLVMIVFVPPASATGTQSDEVPDSRRTESSRAPWFDADPETVQRIDAGDPIGTAVEVSRVRFADETAELVVISRDDVFADSLAGTVFATRGPILLTGSEALDGRVAAEVDRVLPAGGIVYLLGGTSALSPQVELALEGYDVRRLSGASRVETSVAVAREFNAHWDPPGGRVVLARSDDWADSITASVWAAGRAPILLTPTSRPHPAVEDYLREDWSHWFVVAGGENAVNESVVDRYMVASTYDNIRVDRVAGNTRTATAAVFDTWYNGEYDNDIGGASHHVVINGFASDGWVYGLPAAALTTGALRGRNTSLMLVDTNRIDAPVAARVSPCYDLNRHILVVGPTDRVSSRVADAMKADCVGDVIAPVAGDGWLCERLGNVPQEYWNDPIITQTWEHPIDWFDTTSITGACYVPRTTLVLGGADVVDWGTSWTSLSRSTAEQVHPVDLLVDGIPVHGWAYDLPSDTHGNTWGAAALFAEGPDGRVAYIELAGERHQETGEWLRLDDEVLLDFMVDFVRMR